MDFIEVIYILSSIQFFTRGTYLTDS